MSVFWTVWYSKRSIQTLKAYPYCQATVVVSDTMGEPVCVIVCVWIALRVVVVAVLILQVSLILANPLVVLLVVGAAHHKTLLIVCCLKDKSDRTSHF